MNVNLQHSVQARITFGVLAIFLASLWSLSYYASQVLRRDMQSVLGEQQFSTVSFIAANINEQLGDRLKALQTVAQTIEPATLANDARMQKTLEQLPLLQNLFNGGVIAYRLDGTAIAEVPQAAKRIGVNYMDIDTIAAALKEGKSTFGQPVIGKKLLAPVFGITAPIRDAQGKVIGALSGVTNLGKPNFLDQLSNQRFGTSGGYVLLAPRYRLVVTATDKNRVMQPLPAPGINPAVDRFVNGYEGYAVYVNPLGVEVLGSAKSMPISGWSVGATLPTQEAFAPIRIVQQSLMLATALLTLLAGVLAWWMIGRQLKPMLVASKMLATMSDSSQPLQPLPISRRDEIGQLIAAFNSLAVKLVQREDALRESEERYRTLVENSPESIAVHAGGNIIYVNPAAMAMFGAESPQALVGTPIIDRVQPDFRESQLARVEAIASHGLTLPMAEVQLLKMDGTTIDAAVQGNRITYDGAPAVQVTMRDVTERKQAERELRIAAIAFECQEGIIVMDASMKILRVNQAFTKITGYTQEDAQGKTSAILRSDKHPGDFYEDVWRKTRQLGSWQGEMWHRRKNGNDYPERVTITAVKDEAGRVTHFVGNLTDATNTHLQEQQRLIHESAQRDTLVREVHHRIKNNLQGILGLLRQFARKSPEMTDTINQAIGQIQSISVIHGLQGRAVKSSVRLCELTGEIANEVQSLWQTPVHVDIPLQWLPCVIDEREAVPIALVLNELILNAIKHGGKAHGHVAITIRKGEQPDMVQIKIHNRGQLAIDARHSNTPHSGLQLVAALMPRSGAKLFRQQEGELVVTVLDLKPPVLSLDQDHSV